MCKLKDNCFTEFCGFLSCINKNQPQVHPRPLPPRPPSYLPPHPTLQPVVEPLFEFPEAYSKFPLAIFTHGIVNFYVTFQYSCLENPMDGGAWWAAVHGVSKSQTPLSDFTFIFHFHALEKEMATHSSVLGLENPRDGGDWWAAVYGVTQSRTRLKRLSSSMLLSPCISPSPFSPPTMSIGLFSMSVSPLLP